MILLAQICYAGAVTSVNHKYYTLRNHQQTDITHTQILHLLRDNTHRYCQAYITGAGLTINMLAPLRDLTARKTLSTAERYSTSMEYVPETTTSCSE